MLRIAVKRLVETGLEQRHQLNEGHAPLLQFCVMMDHVMRHGLKGRSLSPFLYYTRTGAIRGPSQSVRVSAFRRARVHTRTRTRTRTYTHTHTPSLPLCLSHAEPSRLLLPSCTSLTLFLPRFAQSDAHSSGAYGSAAIGSTCARD